MSEPWKIFWQGVLWGLQVLALGLCACILSNMAIEQARGLPHNVCVEGPTSETPNS